MLSGASLLLSFAVSLSGALLPRFALPPRLASLPPPATCFRVSNSTRQATSAVPIMPHPNSSWRPVCTSACCNPTAWPRRGRYCPRCDARRCSQAGATVTCCTPEKDGGTRLSGASKTARGGWRLAASYTYFLDQRLARALARLFAGQSVLEFGAGLGCYTSALRDSRGAGLADVRGFDGAPGVAELSEGLVGEADLTTGLQLGAADWVLSLEVGEHIPRVHEALLLRNLASHSRLGLVLSWSSSRGGRGHVNPRPQSYVVARMAALGFEPDRDAAKRLARAATVAYWIGRSVMVYRRRAHGGDGAAPQPRPSRGAGDAVPARLQSSA